MNTTPHGRRERLRKPALAAAVAALGAPAVAPAEAQTPATAPAIQLQTSHHLLVGRKIKIKGALPGPAGRRVYIQASRRGHGWTTVARRTTGNRGAFGARVRIRRIGGIRIRAVGPDGARSKVRTATVYRSVFASYYGPGLYGNRLACGGRLTPHTIGVAHKTMRCGTKVRLRYRGRTLTVRVVDRGPYVGGRTYDLTAATKRRLHFGTTGHVWSSR